MFLRKRVILGSILVLAGLLANAASAQKAGDGSAAQRLEVMESSGESFLRSEGCDASKAKAGIREVSPENSKRRKGGLIRSRLSYFP